jgi:hypothetical protein
VTGRGRLDRGGRLVGRAPGAGERGHVDRGRSLDGRASGAGEATGGRWRHPMAGRMIEGASLDAWTVERRRWRRPDGAWIEGASLNGRAGRMARGSGAKGRADRRRARDAARRLLTGAWS